MVGHLASTPAQSEPSELSLSKLLTKCDGRQVWNVCLKVRDTARGLEVKDLRLGVAKDQYFSQHLVAAVFLE
jgi:hypothetical protein